MKREEYMALLDKIAESGGFTEAMLDDIKKLKDDYDEREGMEQYNREDVYDGDVLWKDRYTEMKQRYKERFFAPVDVVIEEPKDEIDENQVKFEDLWEDDK